MRLIVTVSKQHAEHILCVINNESPNAVRIYKTGLENPQHVRSRPVLVIHRA